MLVKLSHDYGFDIEHPQPISILLNSKSPCLFHANVYIEKEEEKKCNSYVIHF